MLLEKDELGRLDCCAFGRRSLAGLRRHGAFGIPRAAREPLGTSSEHDDACRHEPRQERDPNVRKVPQWSRKTPQAPELQPNR